MAKKFRTEDKALRARETKDMVRVRIKPYRAVHGYGGPGWEGEMPRDLAESLAQDGYVEILNQQEVQDGSDGV